MNDSIPYAIVSLNFYQRLSDFKPEPIDFTGSQFKSAVSLPTGRNTEPWTKISNYLKDFPLLVEVNGINGKAHKAHMNTVARRDEQSSRGRQGLFQHQANKARPECISDSNL